MRVSERYSDRNQALAWRDSWPGLLAGIAAATLAIYGAWATLDVGNIEHDRGRPIVHETTLTLRQWLDGGWRSLPVRRIDLSGDREEALRLQWADDSAAVSTRLEAAGWRPAPAWSAQSALLWLTSGLSVGTLPVLPRLSNGYGAELTFVKVDPTQPLDRMVLRLWQSNYQVTTIGADRVPVWYGTLYTEIFRPPGRLLTFGSATRLPDAVTLPSVLPLGSRTLSFADGESAATRHVVLVLPAGMQSSAP
ncbi:hypothetical protein WK34_04100 [Burkholderia vietnamiensis]|nr:hypothetical protein WK34_04100 [Burkholderia vietnamiensis]